MFIHKGGLYFIFKSSIFWEELENVINDYWIEDGKLLLTRYTGSVTGQEMITSTLEKSGDERFDRVKYILQDWTQVEDVYVSRQNVRELVACLRPISRICPKAKNASIVNPDDTGSALMAWYKYLADDLTWEVDIFTSHAEAEAWCDLYLQYVQRQQHLNESSA